MDESNFPRVEVVGIPWYKREDYPRLLQIFEDSAKLPVTFDGWLSKAENIAKKFEERGVLVVRAVIDPDTFSAWCASQKLKVDASARTMFANIRSREEAIRRHGRN